MKVVYLMYGDDDKEVFYSFVDKVVSVKGEGWFNAWSESNPIRNFHKKMRGDELSDMINEPEISHISMIDYGAMKRKLKSDMREH